MGLKPDQGMTLRRMHAVSWVWEFVLAATWTVYFTQQVSA